MLQVAGGPQRGAVRMSRLPVCAPVSHGVAAGHIVMAEVTCKDLLYHGAMGGSGAWNELG